MAAFRTAYIHGARVREVRQFPKFERQYCYDVDKDTGKKIVVVSGQSNVFLQKQEAESSTKLYNLIDRVQRTGDMSLLGQAVEGYFDATSLPRDLMQAKQIELKALNLYRALPVEEKAKYNNDFNTFVEKVNAALHENAAKAAAAAREAAKAKEVKEGGLPANE